MYLPQSMRCITYTDDKLAVPDHNLSTPLRHIGVNCSFPKQNVSQEIHHCSQPENRSLYFLKDTIFKKSSNDKILKVFIKSRKLDRSSFLLQGNLWKTWGFYVFSMMFSWEISRFPFGFHYVNIGNLLFLVVSLMFPFRQPGFPSTFFHVFPLENQGFHVVFT